MRSDRYNDNTTNIDEILDRLKKEVDKGKKEEQFVADYSEDPMVEPVYEDVDDLDSAPIPSFREKRVEKYDMEDETTQLELNDYEETTDIELNTTDVEVLKTMSREEKAGKEKPESKGSKKKKYAKRLMMISGLFIPSLIVLYIISRNSNLLIAKPIAAVVTFLLGMFIALFVVGAVLFVQKIKAKSSKRFPTWGRVIYGIFMTGYVTGCTAVIFLLYGPYTGFRDWLVTTAMNTMDHQHYCKWFYSQKQIDEVFSRHYFRETGESTNVDLININTDTINTNTYANKYEEEILKRNPEDLYKIIDLEVNGQAGYLAVIYDPSKVRVATTNYLGRYGQYVVDMAKRDKAVVAINGGGFYDPGNNSDGGCPTGVTISQGKIITDNTYGSVGSGGIIGFTEDHKLVLLRNTSGKQAREMGIRDAVSWGPFLIVNGQPAFSSGNGGWGYAARTAIGQRADGIVLMLVVDSNYNRSKGASMVDLTEIMMRYGAVNAANLDGGTSSVIAVNGELINNPIDSALRNRTRPIPTAFIVTE